MYHVYILLNETKTRTYTGVADDVDKRLAEHNAGRVISSSPYRPYEALRAEARSFHSSFGEISPKQKTLMRAAFIDATNAFIPGLKSPGFSAKEDKAPYHTPS